VALPGALGNEAAVAHLAPESATLLIPLCWNNLPVVVLVCGARNSLMFYKISVTCTPMSLSMLQEEELWS